MLFLVYSAHAQEANKDVTITSSGSGKTLEDAQSAALRSATEQAFGAFISSKTEMFNDQVVADQMASVSSGNIKSFVLLNKDQLPDGRWGVTLKAVVSVDKLTSFVQAKGVAIEIKGGMFALNIKQQLLNEQGEINAVAEMVGLLHEPMQISFDYAIKSSDPKSLDAESKNWEIPLVVTATCNKNIDFCANYFKKTLTALSLTSAEIQSYKSLNKQVFPFAFNYLGQNITFYLRKQTSISVIKSFLSNWEFYTRLFVVKSGLDEYFSIGKGRLFALFTNDNYDNKFITVSFPTVGKVAGIFTWNDERTLTEINQMTGYLVNPRGVISSFKYGGYVVWENDGHGLVAALCDLGKFDWENAKIACEELVMNGYSDWYLPSKQELNSLYENMKEIRVGGFDLSDYWSSTIEKGDFMWKQYFTNGGQNVGHVKFDKCIVRAVRFF